MSQQFNEVRVGTSARSTFDLKHHQVTTSDFGYLIPICVRDMVPNDDYTVTPSLFCRLAPMAFPAYGRITCRVHSFFVPYRLLYGHWNEFITQSSSNNTIPPYFTVSTLRSALATDPQFTSTTGLDSKLRGMYGRVMANLGLNPDIVNSDSGLSNNDRISAFRWLAYYRIWLDWFMDSNLNDHSSLVSAFNDNVRDGGSMAVYAGTYLRYRNACYGKDYFTTAKLHPQQSTTPSKISVLTDTSLNPGLADHTGASALYESATGGKIYRNASGFSTNATNVIGSFSVEDLRAATSLQRYLERNNYVGTKVINQLLAHFGIAPTPERLDMSEYIGGSNFNVQIGDVTSTTPDFTQSSVQTVGLGAQAGKGIAAAQTETVRYHAKEHGVFMTLLSIIPDTAYYQGVPKVMQLGVTGDALDFYTPEFENLGYQEILNKEVFVPKDVASDYQSYDPDGIFGYAPRYAFLKWQNDILAGDFVGNLTQSSVMGAQMDAWHLFRHLVYDDSSPLALNDNFVECSNKDNDYDRIFQVTDNMLDHFYFNIDVDVKATRDMVSFAEPSLDSVNMEDGNKINLPYGGTRL